MILSSASQLLSRHLLVAHSLSSSMAASCAFSTNENPDNKGKKVYIHATNYNLENYKQYTQEVQAAIQQLEDTQCKEDTLSDFEKLPRRKRRVYDRPLHDLDISNYNVWRAYDKMIFKTHKHAARILCKINIAPKHLRHVFGEGHFQSRNDGVSTREFNFEDTNQDAFLVYDYKGTTEYYGKKQKKEVEKRQQDKSYEEKVIEKLGSFEIFDKFDQQYELESQPSVFKFGREFYLEKGKKFIDKELEVNPYLRPIKPAKQMDETHRVSWPYQWNPKPTQA